MSQIFERGRGHSSEDLPDMTAEVELRDAAPAAGLFVCGHVCRGSGDASYVGQQAGVAIVLAMVQGAAPSSDIVPAIDRMVGAFGGILVVAACHPVLAPVVRRLIGPAPET
jgi:hypothetical protein